MNNQLPHFFQVLDLSRTYPGQNLEVLLEQLIPTSPIPLPWETTLTTLNLNYIGLEEHFFDVMGGSIRYIETLQHLSMEGNYVGNVITVAESIALQMSLPQGIKIISMALNNFPSIERNNYLWQIGQWPLEGVEGFNMSWQVSWSDGFFKQDFCSNPGLCEITIPPKMKWLDLSHNGFQMSKLPDIIFMNNNTFERFYASNTHLKLFNNRFYCSENIVPNIQYVDISDNEIICFNETIFQYCDWSSLTYLNLKGNRLGHSQIDECNEDSTNFLKFLKPLKNLQILDISDNVVNVNPAHNSFESLSNLRSLYMSGMGLTGVHTSFSYLLNLQFLDLSGNSLRSLTASTIRELESLWRGKPNDTLTVEMSNNMLKCDCDSIFFLKWLKDDKRIIKVPNYKSFSCETTDGQMHQFVHLQNIITRLESKCIITLWEIPKTVFGWMSAIYAIITISTLSYRFRFYFRYQILVLRMKRLHLENILDEREWDFHAFVSCERHDAIWIKRSLLPNIENDNTGIRLCIAQRDFIVGSSIIDNIVQCTSRSRKVIIILSQNFLKSGWCLEEFMMAHNVSVPFFVVSMGPFTMIIIQKEKGPQWNPMGSCPPVDIKL